MATLDTYQNNTSSFGATFKVYLELVKMRLSLLVAFSSGFGYTLGAVNFSWTAFTMLFIGGFLVSGASITINQIIERDLDKLMKRTESRPLPTARITVKNASIFAVVVGLSGFILLMLSTNWLTVALSALSMVLYSFVYTPLKRVGPVAVFVGALPGALPPLIGWVAATGAISVEAMVIFALQFIWQFPHFWAIAWVADDDYKKAGFKLLPSGGGKNMQTAFQIMIYTLVLIPLGMIPAQFGITGMTSAFVVTTVGVLFFAQTFYLMKQTLSQKTDTRKAALSIMFGSFLYLPIVQISFLLDKI
ncbi:MAG: protoheme IX farnesyltransferase [Bacteroidetes bacterium]|nr:MAG: protoheme IX farnesyltransferase [Bacteroidota bacterium]